MARNQLTRLTKLEAMTDMSEKHLVIPLCCFYSKEDRECDCVSYWTREPRVIKEGMGAFYEEIEKRCVPMPDDAEPADMSEAWDTV